jgi:DNA invertase Pin-like site-specific DNA recombinase
MGNSLVIRNGTSLAKRDRALRAAQYVRMSTNHQRYSIENQAAAIAAYAATHNLTIVRTYADRGESGLQIKNRAGLIELLADVSSGQADFGYILVYDVSRWGRFQDTDESAHYEFLCKQAGFKVVYCAEQFDNDDTLLSSIVKNLKRVMAAEYSRELSVKVRAGKCRLAGLGFWQNSYPCFALDRELVDEHEQSKGLLRRGDRKYLQTDHVRLRPSSSDEVAIVKWIFYQYVTKKITGTEIARHLNEKGISTQHGRPWNCRFILRILKNENYIGNLVYNRISRRLGQNPVKNPVHMWIRAEAVIEPIIERNVFFRAQRMMEERRVDLPEEEMLARLRAVLKKRGKLSTAIIDETVGIPTTPTYRAHFGTLRKAYSLVGYLTKHNCDFIDFREHWVAEVAELKKKIADSIEKAGKRSVTNDNDDYLLVDGKVGISFRVARRYEPERPSHSPRWNIERRRRCLPPGWVVTIRQAEVKRTVLDYLLFPTSDLVKPIRCTEEGLTRYNVRFFQTPEALVRSIVTLTAKDALSNTAGTKRRRATRNKKNRITARRAALPRGES